MVSISVIVVSWNGKHFLEVCLSSLRGQTYRDFEIIVVDNGSSDGSVEFVREKFPDVRLIALKENRGFTGANLAGYREARGELIALLNNDTEAHPRWLEALHEASVKFPEAGSFASKMLLFDDRKRIDNCGFAMTTAAGTMDLGRGEMDGPQWSEPREVFGACGGAALYRRSMLEKVGFFDDDFFMAYEDVDLGFRAQLQGFKCIFVPEAIVYHHMGGTMRNYTARQVFFSQRNFEYVYLKNMPLGLGLRFFPQRMWHEISICLSFCLLGQAGPFFAAKLDVVRHLPMLLKKRGQILRARTVSVAELRAQLYSISWGEEFRRKWEKFRTALPGLRRNASLAVHSTSYNPRHKVSSKW